MQTLRSVGTPTRADRAGFDPIEVGFVVAQAALVVVGVLRIGFTIGPRAGANLGVELPLTLVAVQFVRGAAGQKRGQMAWLLLALSVVLLGAENGLRDDAVRFGGDVRLVTYGLIGVGAQFALAGGVMVLLARRGHRSGAGWGLDAIVAACGASAVGMVLWDTVGMPQGSIVALALYIAPSVVGLATLLVLAQAVMVGGWRDQVLGFVTAAVLAREAAALAVLLRATPGKGAAGFDPRLGWLAFALFGSMAALAERRRGPWRPTGTVPSVVAGSWIVPALCMGGAVGILVWGQYRPQRLEVTFLAVATLAISVVRAAAGNREVQLLNAAEAESRTDELSGLLNRRGFTKELRRATASRAGALLVVDIDRFREVNELLGHDAGDEVLRQVAARLRRAASGHDVLARLGGDQFVVLVDERTTAGALELARGMRGVLEGPVNVAGMAVRLNASVGVRVWSDVGADHGAEGAVDADRVLSDANHAVRQAKTSGTGVERYDPERDADGSRRLALTDALRRSLARRELTLHYQPKVDLLSGRVLGVEALARWSHGDLPVSPALFVELAEEAGMIGDLTKAMLDQALAQARRWEDEGIPLVVSVNVSPRNLLEPDLPHRVQTMLLRHGVDASQLILEITETTLVPDPIRTSEVLAELRAMGIRLSIDDYGTGHAALAYLRDFPVDELKLDRSYVAGMVADHRTAAIVRSTVELGRRLGLTVVAEGVERQEELDAVAACGCTVVQGFLMCRPLPGDEVSAWVRRRFVAARGCA